MPAVHRLLDDPRLIEAVAMLGRETVKRAVEDELARARAGGAELTFDDVLSAVRARLAELELERFVPVVNATGVLLHTNLGRAPLAAEAVAAMARLSAYSNLEYDLATGTRGSRYDRLRGVLCELTGAPDALVVNNGAAAVLLVLDTFARGRDVIVSRNQLVEIGGGFRVPDVIARSGARLVEVGTTNRVYARDFERALSPITALLLRTHPSNFAIEGFTNDLSGEALAAIARRVGVPSVEDLGGGALTDLSEYGLPRERTVGDVLHDGIDLVTFSGDKLVGGPQAGIVVGRAASIARLRANPLLRALRVDKATLAALEATLELHRTRAGRERIPLYRMLATSLGELRSRARAYVEAIAGAAMVDSQARVGAGTLPTAVLASVAIALPLGGSAARGASKPDALLAALRGGDPPIVARIEDARVLLDLRTVQPNRDDEVIAAALKAVGDQRDDCNGRG